VGRGGVRKKKKKGFAKNFKKEVLHTWGAVCLRERKRGENGGKGKSEGTFLRQGVSNEWGSIVCW